VVRGIGSHFSTQVIAPALAAGGRHKPAPLAADFIYNSFDVLSRPAFDGILRAAASFTYFLLKQIK
jgi:hypothetical protein